MADIFVIISKAQFEGEHRAAKVGDALGYSRYVSTHAAIEPVGAGGSLFLVTVRPPDERLWLLAELRDPKHDGKAWVAARATTAVRDITDLIPKLKFASGKGITAKKGALGMSLQTPRALTAEDVALLRGGKASKSAPDAVPSKRAAPEADAKPTSKRAAAPAPEVAESKPASKRAAAPAEVADTDAKPASKRAAVPAEVADTDAKPASKRAAVSAEDGLAAALAQWRTTRAPELEALIITLGQHHARAFPPLDPEADDYDAQWTARANTATAEGLDHLLPGLWSDPRGSIPLRVRKLLDLGADPRLGEAFLKMIDDPPLTASSNFGAWTTLFKALPDLVDTRAKKRLEARLKKKGGASQFWPKLNGLIERALEVLPEPAALSKADAAGVAAQQKKAAALLKGPPPAATVKAKSAPAPMKGSPREALEEAVKAAQGGNALEALEPLRLYWVTTRSTRAADVLTKLGDALPGESLDGKPKEVHARWLAAGKTFDAKQVTPLLAALLKGTLSDAEERLEVMLGWAPDPRVADAMINRLILGRDPYIGARPQLFKRAYDLLVLNADPRFSKKLQDNAKRLENAAGFDRNRAERPHATRTVEPYLAAAGTGRDPSADEAKLLGVLEAAVTDLTTKRKSAAKPDQEVALLRAIADAPTDTTPLIVYADFLTERGDPRAEFVNLCVEAEGGKAVKGKLEAWIRAKGHALVGGLPKPWKLAMGEKGNVARGFMTSVSLTNLRKVQDKDVAAMLEDPRWAAVTNLGLMYEPSPLADAVLSKAPLFALEFVSSASAANLELMAARDFPWKLSCVELRGAREGEKAPLLPSKAATAFPHLREVRLPIFHQFDGSEFATPFLAKVTTLQIGDENSAGKIALDVVLKRAFENEALQTLKILGSPADVVATRVGAKLDLAIEHQWLNVHNADDVKSLGALERIPAKLVNSITVGPKRKDQPLDAKAQKLFDAAIAHLPRR